jgi:hypothetical protein
MHDTKTFETKTSKAFALAAWLIFCLQNSEMYKQKVKVNIT